MIEALWKYQKSWYQHSSGRTGFPANPFQVQTGYLHHRTFGFRTAQLQQSVFFLNFLRKTVRSIFNDFHHSIT